MLRSLLARNLMLTAMIVVLSQAATIGLAWTFIFRPQVDRLAVVLARNISALSVTIGSVPPTQRKALIARINDAQGFRIRLSSEPPSAPGTRPSIIETIVLDNLAKSQGGKHKIEWRGGGASPLWVRLNLAGDYYWLAVEAPPAWAALEPLVAAILISMGLAFTAGVVLHRVVNRPLERLTAAMELLPQDVGLPALAARSPREIATLALAFERLRTRLVAQDGDRTFMLAGISHDLKTPLAKIRLALALRPLDSPEDQAMVDHQLDRLDQMLAQFLDFGRGIEGEEVAVVDALTVIGRAVRAQQSGVPKPIHSDQRPLIAVRPLAFERALINLLRNAELHGRAPVEITMTCDRAFVTITVADRGPGVPEHLLSQLIRPFMRVGRARSSDGGVGLGLAMVSQFAVAHGGLLNFANREGGGFQVTLSLPIASRPLQ